MARVEPQPLDFRRLYDSFDAPIAAFDCGQKCAPLNPSGKPFCCDICQAVPAVYRSEWDYLRGHTDLWHVWRGDECALSPEDPAVLLAETPETMLLLACLGPERCRRPYRALSCRQFPFFPYITSGGAFIGLAYEWEFEATCWVIRHLEVVSQAYRDEFVRAYDGLFERQAEVFESYAWQSQDMRQVFLARRRRIPLLHRNGQFYRLSPGSERLRRMDLPHDDRL